MRILLLINSLNVGGAEQSLVKLVLSTQSENVESIVVTLTKGDGYFEDALKKNNIMVHHIGLNKDNKFSLFKLYKLVVIFLEHRPNILQSWLYQSDLISIIVRLFFSVPVIWNIRQSNLSVEHNKLFTRICMKICAYASYKFPDKIVCNSFAARLAHIEIGYDPSKFVVIHNGFEIENSVGNNQNKNMLKTMLNLTRVEKIIGMVGRYDSQKNYRGFFAIASKVFDDFPDIHYCLFGEGVDEANQELNGFLENCKVPKTHIHLMGRSDDVKKKMEEFEILILPSLGESFPNVIGEAMAVGTVCVANDVGDCRLIIGDAGFIVEGDEGDFAKTIIRVLKMNEDEMKNLQKLAKEKIEKCFSQPKMVEEYKKLYSKVLRLHR